MLRKQNSRHWEPVPHRRGFAFYRQHCLGSDEQHETKIRNRENHQRHDTRFSSPSFVRTEMEGDVRPKDFGIEYDNRRFGKPKNGNQQVEANENVLLLT